MLKLLTLTALAIITWGIICPVAAVFGVIEKVIIQTTTMIRIYIKFWKLLTGKSKDIKIKYPRP